MFGCPRRIITDNDVAFNSKKLVEFCKNYGIMLSHSTTYYPKANGLAKSSNKSLTSIIKNLLQENKKSWNKKLIFALQADRASTKKYIDTSPFQLVYGTKVIFPMSIGLPIMKLLQEVDDEPNHVQRRISQLVHVHQMREEVLNNVQLYQDKIKIFFDRRNKADDFQINDLVLKWDARIEDKGKHSKFENLWKGPCKVASYHGNNAFLL